MAEHLNNCYSTELIDRNGTFNTYRARKFVEDLKMAAQGRPVSTVSIIGPQSSGKSTLLNHLFNTDFKEMDAERGRLQTTNGIWVGRSRLRENCILVIDTEGSDGAEREEDTKFEKQTALFALAISNTVIINMMCTDVGRNNGAGWPLLKIVFEVMIRRFSTPRKVTLVFVLRDKTKTPLDKLEKQLTERMNKIWDEIKKPRAEVNTKLTDRFEIKVEALVNYELKQEQFKEEVESLRERIINYSTSGEAASDRTAASGFGDYSKKIWDEIKEDKDLDLPSYRNMVSEVRCDQIVHEKYQSFLKDESWLQIKEEAESSVVQGFGRKISSLVQSYLSKYDGEALHFVKIIRDKKRKQFREKLVEAVEPAYKNVMKHLRHETMKSFKKAIVIKLATKADVEICTNDFLVELKKLFADAAIRQANSNYASQQLDKFERDMDAYIDKARDEIKQREEHERELNRIRHQVEQHEQDDEKDKIYKACKAIMGIVTFVGLFVGLPSATAS